MIFPQTNVCSEKVVQKQQAEHPQVLSPIVAFCCVNPGRAGAKSILIALSFVLALAVGCARRVVVDSDLNADQAIFQNQPPDVSADVQSHLCLVEVRYHGFDGKVHQGQLVIHKALAEPVPRSFSAF